MTKNERNLHPRNDLAVQAFKSRPQGRTDLGGGLGCGVVVISQERVHRAKRCDCSTDEVRVCPADVGHLRSGVTTSISKMFQVGEDSRTPAGVSLCLLMSHQEPRRTSEGKAPSAEVQDLRNRAEEQEEDEEKKIQQEEPSDKKTIQRLFLL